MTEYNTFSSRSQVRTDKQFRDRSENNADWSSSRSQRQPKACPRPHRHLGSAALSSDSEENHVYPYCIIASRSRCQAELQAGRQGKLPYLIIATTAAQMQTPRCSSRYRLTLERQGDCRGDSGVIFVNARLHLDYITYCKSCSSLAIRRRPKDDSSAEAAR